MPPHSSQPSDSDVDSQAEDELPLLQSESEDEERVIGRPDVDKLDASHWLNWEKASEIQKAEEQLLSAKPWEMKGEVLASQRPKDSLLSQHLDFQLAQKQPPIQTEEKANTLEQIIKQRIKDRLFDDPIRLSRELKEDEAPQEEMLQFEKSKRGLSELYEKEYAERVLQYPRSSEEETLKRELDDHFLQLFSKLDSLANYYSKPKAPEKERSGASNIPAFKMEESVPISFSNHSASAPEEVFSKKVSELQTEEDKDSTERRRLRRKRKRAIHHHLQEKVAKLRRMGMAQVPRKFMSKILSKQGKGQESHSKTKEMSSSKFFSSFNGLREKDGTRAKGVGSKDKRAGAKGVVARNQFTSL